MKNNYLLETEDTTLLEKKIEELINKNSFSNAYKSVYDLEEVSLDNALEDLDTYSFLSDKKVIIIKNCFSDNNENRLNHLLKYIDNYNKDNLLILTTRKIDNRLNIIKSLKKNDNIEIISIEVDPFKYVKDLLKGYKIDNSNKTPGFKFAEAEVKGYPIRIEVGARDLENNNVTIVRRDTLEKNVVKKEEVINTILSTLKTMQTDMYNKALKRRDSMLYNAKDIEEFEKYTKMPGFIKTNWCGSRDCEDKVKEEYGLSSRCIVDEKVDGKCPFCNKDAKYKIYWGKQY